MAIGTATIAANFGTDRATTTLSNLDGTQANGITATTNVSDLAVVTITDSIISGAAFSEGTTTVTSTTLSALSAAPSVSVNGAFFGPIGQEAGGVIALDDTATGNLRIFGDFIAQ